MSQPNPDQLIGRLTAFNDLMIFALNNILLTDPKDIEAFKQHAQESRIILTAINGVQKWPL